MESVAEVYRLDLPKVTVRGISLKLGGVGAEDGSLASTVRDDAGIAAVEEFLRGVAETDFATEAIEELLSVEREPEDWRVGEAIAEQHLDEHHSYDFPWPQSRDLRDPNASLPGADLVGFHDQADADPATRFAFGEVKTSSDEGRPPSVVYGRHGLKQQLEELRELKPLRDLLVRYLAFRALGSDWRSRFMEAIARYLRDPSDVVIAGVLVRDVGPDSRDLEARATALSEGCPEAMEIELFGLYLPDGTIEGLGRAVAGQGEEANDDGRE